MPKILFIGDIVGKPGRSALRQVLPQWRKKYQPDAVIVNVENLAHGKGVTMNTMSSISDLDIDVYTSGNHVFDKGDLSAEVFEKYPNLIRPDNYLTLNGGSVPGHGYYRFSKSVERLFTDLSAEPSLLARRDVPKGQRGRNQALSSGHLISNSSPQGEEGQGTADESANYTSQQFLILNLNATVFMENQFDGEIANPFLAVDKLLLDQGQKGDIIIVDFHSEATSEKVSFGYYCDGRVTAVLGTHTHVPTADARILPSSTAYISDVGMTGARDSVLGVKKENALKKFLDPAQKFKNEPEEEGVLQVNGVLIETSHDGKAVRIEKLYQEV